MMLSNSQKTQLDRYTALKNQVELPVKIKLYFLIFDNAMETNKAPRSIQSKKGFSKALLNAFTNLSTQQKGLYLLDGLNYVLEQLDKEEKDKTKSDSKSVCITDEIKHIETTCEMVFTTMKISHWTTVSFKLDKIKKQINITNKKKHNVIQLKNYYVRKSKKYKATLVLEAIIDDINNQGKKYIFSFSTQVVHRMYEEILKCIFICQHEKLLSMLAEDDDEDKMSASKVSHHSNPEKTLVFLSSKNINDYISYKEKVSTQIMKNKFDFKPIHKRENGLTIEQSLKIDKVFKLENSFEIQAKVLKQKFIYAFNHKNKFILHSEILEDFSKKYKALYEKYSIGGKVHEFIAIRQQTITNQQQILFIKGIENVMSKVHLEFLQVKVRTLNPFKSRLIIYCSLNIGSALTRQVGKTLLFELNDMILRKQDIQLKMMATEINEDNQTVRREMEGEDNDDQDEFRTVRGSEQFVDFMEDDGGESEMNTSRMKMGEQFLMNDINSHHYKEGHKYLTKKHSTVPVDNKQFRQYMKNHYLFKEWVRLKTGGVVCTNQQIVNIQKNLFKTTIAKMGRGIFKGEIFKLSIPVIIFKKQSHLESIGKDFCFAPTFFDKVAQSGDSLERVKYASLLAISVGTLGISMDKPFNPILGETFQGWIDGCPIYLEQISHHPPIGAYFMKGRGYKIHGQIQPKISFGLNNIKGYSDLPNFLQFDDGSQIQMVYGKMVIKGILFGDRQFNFQDRIYAYDKKNHIFSEICFGQRKKAIKKKKADPNDFFYGTIYQLKPDFLQKFEASRPRIYPSKDDILKQLSFFEGVWNDSCTFDGKQYINFRTDLPHDLLHEQQPLLSNSSFRSDLIKVIEGDLVEAQKQKDRLQEIQRRDRRLRQKYGPKQQN